MESDVRCLFLFQTKKEMKINKENIAQRSAKLEEARTYLKTQFVGIDEVIDKFINSVKIWYILPEVQSRPVIVNLWGITGVAKTDLVRKFVNFIDFSDKFCEIQMDSKEGTSTLEAYLETTFESAEMQGILLLDEIQRFRTVNEDGKENSSSKFQDLWMLLSDGVFQSNSNIKQELMRMIIEEDFWDERSTANTEDKKDTDEEKSPEDDKDKKRIKAFKYRMHFYEASRLKKLLKLSEDVSKIMTLNKEEELALIKEKLSNKETFQGRKYSNLLIIISGNLDEAFRMAGGLSVGDSDLDADVFHAFSKTIDIVKIKNALRNRFKPEQIARLGNIHIIYPIPNRASYSSIIKQKVALIVNEIRNKHKISIKIDKSVLDVIYQNGVFPAQGVRPLLSTISAILENSLPEFLFEYLNQGSKQPIKLSYSDSYLRATIGKKEVKYLIPRVLDDIKKTQTINYRSLVSIHEAGHAVAYAILFRTVPTQIVSNTANSENGGFIGTHNNLGSKENMRNNIIVSLAGRVAEEIIFGEKNITAGASSDYFYATSVVSQMVRKVGMDDSIGVFIAPSKNDGTFMHNIDHTDERMESILSELYSECVTLIMSNKEFLLATAVMLFERQKIKQDEFKKLAKTFIGTIGIVDPKDNIEVDFHKKFLKALSENGQEEVELSNFVS